MHYLQTALKKILVMVHGIAGFEIVYREGAAWEGNVSTYVFHCSGHQHPLHVNLQMCLYGKGSLSVCFV